MDGWNEDRVTALLEHMADISRALDRIAVAEERVADSHKIGGAFDRLAVAMNHVADAVNRNTTMGGR